MDSDDLSHFAAEIEALKSLVTSLRVELGEARKKIAEIRNLVGPFGVSMPDGTMLVQTLYDTKYYIDPNDYIIAPNLIVYRQWEADLSALMVRSVNANTVFVDVGANFGYFTCLLASRIKRSGSGRVFSIEPNPRILDLLRRNISVNWSMSPVDVFACAVSNEKGKAELQVPKNRASNASLRVPTSLESSVVGDEEETISVELRTIDDIVPAGTPVDIMKIDVEGHEWAALAGARRVVSESPDIKIVMEWSQSQMHDAGYDTTTMLNLFDEMQLQVFEIPASLTFDGLTGVGLDRAKLVDIPYGNIILKKKR